MVDVLVSTVNGDVSKRKVASCGFVGGELGVGCCRGMMIPFLESLLS